MQPAEIFQTDNGYIIAYTHMKYGKTIVDRVLAHWTKEQYVEYKKRAEETKRKIEEELNKESSK